MPSMSAAEIMRLAREGAAEGLNLAAERVRAVAVPLTPIAQDGGDLRSSLTVVPATPDDLESAVATDLPYAVKQHEELSYRHPNGGQAKYLETAALESAREVEEIVAAAVRRRLS